MANPVFDLIKAAAKAATGTTVGKVTTVAVVVTVSGVSYKLYQDGHTGDVVGAEVVEKTVAKNDAQGDVRLKMEGLKDAAKDAEAEKAKAEAEAAAKAAEEAAKAKEAEQAKLEEGLKQQREAEEAAMLAEQQAQEQGEENPADEEQNPDELKDENAEDGEGETDADADAEDNEKGSDSFKGGDGDDDAKVDEGGNPIGEGETEENNEQSSNEDDKNGKTEGQGDGTQKTDENGDPIDDKEGQGKNETQEDQGKGETDDKKGKTEGQGDGTQETDENGNLIDDKEGQGEGETDEKNENEGGDNDDNNEDKEANPEGAQNNSNNNDNIDDNRTNNAPEGNVNVNSTFHHGNLGVNTSGGAFVPPSLDEARKAFNAKCKKAVKEGWDNIDLTTVQDDLTALQYLGEGGSVSNGADFAIYEAAAFGVPALFFSMHTYETQSERAEREACVRGIKAGLSRILDNIRNKGFSLLRGSFSIGMNFGMKGEAGVDPDKFEEMLMGDYADVPCSLEVKDGRQDCKITLSTNRQQASQEDPAEAARERLLKTFRENEIVKVRNSDYKLTGVAWAVREAMTDGDSVVKELIFDEIRSAEDKDGSNGFYNFDAIAVGVREALGSSKGLRRDVFSIKVGFKPNMLYQERFCKLALRGIGSGKDVWFNANRIFALTGDAKPKLYGELNERFAKGEGYVHEFELEFLDRAENRKGLKEILLLAAKPESKVKTLSLRTGNGNGEFFVKDRLPELEEALKEICEQEKINRDLKIKTNLRGDEAGDLQFAVNYVYASDGNPVRRNGRQVFASSGGEISFKSNAKLVDFAQIRENFRNPSNVEFIRNYFKKSEVISFDDLLVPGNNAVMLSWINQFKEASNDLEAELIPLAADPNNSKVKTLILNDTHWGLLGVAVSNVLKQPGAIHGFDLRVDNAKKIYDAVMKDKKPEWKHTLEIHNGVLRIVNGVNVPGSGTPTTGSADAGAGGVPGAGKPLAERLAAFERLFGKADEGERFGFRNNSRCAMPRIFAYQAVNAIADAGAKELNELMTQAAAKEAAAKKATGAEKTKLEGELKQLETKIMAVIATAKDVEQDKCLVLDVRTVQESGIKAELDKFAGGENQWANEDLILEAVCFYKKGLYAVTGKPDTRNYFLHSWITDTCAGALECNVVARAEIVRADGIAEQMPFGMGSVNFHYGTAFDANTETKFSPNNFVFKIEKDGASAWFLSEFDTTGKMYTNGNYKGLSDGHGGRHDETVNDRAFPNVGKRRLAIHWTFIEDDDGKLFDEVNKRGVSTTLLPCQFSPNPDERSIDLVKEYLRLKTIPPAPDLEEVLEKMNEEQKKRQEEKKKEQEEKKRKIEAAKHAKEMLEEQLNSESGVCVLRESDLSVAGENFEHIFRRVLAEGKIQTLIVDFKKNTPNATSLLDCVCEEVYKEDANEVTLSFGCLDRAFYNELKALAEQIKSDPDAVFDLIPEDDTYSLTLKKTRKRRLLFELKRTLSDAEGGSDLDLSFYAKGLGLQKVLETVFGTRSSKITVRVWVDATSTEAEDAWVDALRKVGSQDWDEGAKDNKKVLVCGGKDDDVSEMLKRIARRVNSCASVRDGIAVNTDENSIAFIDNQADETKRQDARQQNADKVAEKFKDYPNPIPLAVLTALGEIDANTDTKETVDAKVKKLRDRLVDRSREADVNFISVGKSRILTGAFDEGLLPFVANTLGLNIVIREIERKENEVDENKEVDKGLKFHPTWSNHMSDSVISATMDEAKAVLPGSIAERMLWIKKTTEKKAGAGDKVTYAVDFDTAESFEVDPQLEFVVQEETDDDGNVTYREKQLIVSEKSLKYLRYSQDPESFLKQVLLQTRTEQPDANAYRLQLTGISKAEASFFDALQATCADGQNENVTVSIGYGSGDSGKDAEIQKLVNERFDPWAKTYVVYEGKGKFRYAKGDTTDENTELGRFEKFKEKNPLDENSDFNKIEETKHEWFEREAQRVQAEQWRKEVEKEEEEYARVVTLANQFLYDGGDITVDDALINALAQTGVILRDDFMKFSVLSVIKKAAEAGSRVTKLKVKFSTDAEYQNALGILVYAAKHGGNADLVLEVEDISDTYSVLAEGTQSYLNFQNAVNNGLEDDPVWYLVNRWAEISGCKLIRRRSPEGIKTVCVDKDSVLSSKEDLLSDILDGNATLKDGLDIELALADVFAKAGTAGGEVSLSAKEISADVFETALKDWFGRDENKKAQVWHFVEVDLNNQTVWKQFESLSREVARASDNAVFMYLDRQNNAIWFLDGEQKKYKLGRQEELSLSQTGALEWTENLKTWWWNCAGRKNLAEFTDALAELPGLKYVDFTQLYGDHEGNISDPGTSATDEKLHCYCSAEGLKQLAKCSGVKFVFYCPEDKVAALRDTLNNEDRIEAANTGQAEGFSWMSVYVKKDNGIFAKSDGTLLWNAYARTLLLGSECIAEDAEYNPSTEALKGNFKRFAKVLGEQAAGKGIKSVTFDVSRNRTDNEISKIIARKELWEALRESSGEIPGVRIGLNGVRFVCSKNNWWRDNDGDLVPNDIRSFFTAYKWTLEDTSENIDTVIVKNSDDDGNAEEGNGDNGEHGGGENGENPNHEDEGGNPFGEENEAHYGFIPYGGNQVVSVPNEATGDLVSKIAAGQKSDDVFVNAVKEAKVKYLLFPDTFADDIVRRLTIKVLKDCPDTEGVFCACRITGFEGLDMYKAGAVYIQVKRRGGE